MRQDFFVQIKSDGKTVFDEVRSFSASENSPVHIAEILKIGDFESSPYY